MKRKLILTLLACGASILLGANAQAQSPTPAPSPSAAPGAGHKHGEHGGPDQLGGGMLRRLSDELGLSGSQAAAIAPILEAAKPQLKTIRDNADAQRKQVFDSVSTQITPLLTADQQVKLATILQRVESGPAGGAAGGPENGPRKFGRRGGGGKAAAAANASPGGGSSSDGGAGEGALLQRLTTQLGLSTDQQTQIKPILDAAHTQIQTIRKDNSLTGEQKIAQIKTTMDGARGQINGILTPAQQQQFSALKEKLHNKNHAAGAPSASPTPTAT